MPAEKDLEVKAFVEDHYDIPERLVTRTDDYYREFYGVGTRRLPNETDDSGMAKRLAWLRQHPEVLRYFQERTTLRKVESWNESKDRVNSCSTSQKLIPDTCRNLKLDTMEAIEAYEPLRKQGPWTPGKKVCCTIELYTRAVPDGLKLNPQSADAFVDTLMALETGGGKADYAYLTHPDNRARWVDGWHLVTPTEADIIGKFRITERDNVRFLSMQGASAAQMLLPRCSEEALSPDFLRTDKRNEFVAAWRAGVAKAAAAAPAVPAEAAEGAEATAGAAPAPVPAGAAGALIWRRRITSTG